MSFNKEYSLDNNFSLLQNEDNDDTPKYTFIDLSTNSSHKNLNSFITIPKFKKFLNQSRTYQCRFEHFESPISKAHSFSYQIFLIPSPNELSVTIEFSPKEEQRKNNSITIQLSVYSSVKETFTQITNRTFIVTKENMYLENNYIVYNKNLIVNKMIFPFLLRVRLFQGKKNKPCDEKIGIVNEGNTCYLNTILQNMSNIPYIRKILYDIDSSNDKFILNLQKIFFRLQNSKSPIKISTELRENNFLSAIIPALKEENKIQQDAQEIFSYIFDYLSKKNSLLSELCEGKLKIEIKCDEINHVSSNEENFLFLSLDCNINIPTTNTEGELTLYDCIEHFLSVETLEGDEKTGAKIVLKALEAPLHKIVSNAGLEGAVIINKVRESEVGYGFDAYKEEYVNMVEAGILDPAKVTRSALQNACSVASTLLTTESVVANIKEDAPAMPAGTPGMGGMM